MIAWGADIETHSYLHITLLYEIDFARFKWHE